MANTGAKKKARGRLDLGQPSADRKSTEEVVLPIDGTTVVVRVISVKEMTDAVDATPDADDVGEREAAKAGDALMFSLAVTEPQADAETWSSWIDSESTAMADYTAIQAAVLKLNGMESGPNGEAPEVAAARRFREES